MRRRTIRTFAAGIAATLALAAPGAAQAETTLRAVTGLVQQSVVSQAFLRWVKQVNERGKGIVRIEYIGGPEVTPPPRQAQALRRGLFDILYTPASFYAGEVREVDALLGANLPIRDLRANGAMKKLDELWREQIGSHVLGWFVTTVRFNMYFSTEPKITAEGPDLSGIRLFTTPSLREFQIALGATPVRVEFTEIVTAMERGVIQGIGWPEYGVTGQGFERVIRYRLDPTFYNGNILTIVNAEKWDGLPQKVRDFLSKEAQEYEESAKPWIAEQVDREQALLRERGMRIVALDAETGQKYRETAHNIAWERLVERSPEHGPRLKELMYDPDRF